MQHLGQPERTRFSTAYIGREQRLKGCRPRRARQPTRHRSESRSALTPVPWKEPCTNIVHPPSARLNILAEPSDLPRFRAPSPG